MLIDTQPFPHHNPTQPDHINCITNRLAIAAKQLYITFNQNYTLAPKCKGNASALLLKIKLNTLLREALAPTLSDNQTANTHDTNTHPNPPNPNSLTPIADTTIRALCFTDKNAILLELRVDSPEATRNLQTRITDHNFLSHICPLPLCNISHTRS